MGRPRSSLGRYPLIAVAAGLVLGAVLTVVIDGMAEWRLAIVPGLGPEFLIHVAGQSFGPLLLLQYLETHVDFDVTRPRHLALVPLVTLPFVGLVSVAVTPGGLLGAGYWIAGIVASLVALLAGLAGFLRARASGDGSRSRRRLRR